MTQTQAPPAGGAHQAETAAAVPTTRTVTDNASVLDDLGLLQDLAGTWQGRGFNLIARPDAADQANLYLQLTQTAETLTVTPIGSPIPNRGFGQGDIELHGLSYLQKISDRLTGGALHLEPGLWVTQGPTTYPAEQPPPGGQIIARMGSIPHGTTILAQGSAVPFSGPPVLAAGGVPYAGSVFPSFNSTPFLAAADPVPAVINAAGSSEALTAPQIPAVPFSQYDMSVPAAPQNPRTPFHSDDPPLPDEIDGVLLQDAVNDPIRLLQTVIARQADSGHTFEGVALNIATQASITFRTDPDSPKGASSTVPVIDGNGGASNIAFLDGGDPTGTQGPNAKTAMVYATFWITTVTPRTGRPFQQLQYAQMTVLDFPILTALPAVINLGWPHISVATLRKTFG